jgi:hypothetical protein
VKKTLAHAFAIASLACWNNSPCLAQRPSGPRTLETLLTGEQEAPAVADTSKPAGQPQRPAGWPQGTLVRPEDGVKHPDLDKAWGDYAVTVTAVAENIRTAITKQFDAAAAKGDLDAAEKWQALLKNFEKSGEVPTDSETKSAVSAAVTKYKKAKEELAKAYEDVVKALTMEKRIAEAKAARDELQTAGKATLTDSKPKPVLEERGAAQDRLSKKKEPDASQALRAKFIGLYRNADNGNMEEIRTDGLFTVNGNMSNQWSGKWFLDMNDPKGPCVVRESINNTTSRWYIHGVDQDTIVSHNGVKLRKVR